MAVLKDSPNWEGTSQVVIWSFALAMVCLLGDQLCSAVSQAELLWRALADSATHGAVGAMSWAVVVMPGLSPARWMQCVLCGVLASVLDVDHFLQARSLQLKGAVALQQRPPFHSTSLVLAVTGLLWLTSLGLHLPQLKKLTLACFVAWLSHHLRDAVRRGLWFPPFGSTPPLPYAAYIVATAVLSVAAHVVYSLCSFVSSDTSVGKDLEAGPLSTVLLQ